MKLRRTLSLAALGTTIALSASTASAQAPLPNVFDGGNLWRISFYVDAAPNHLSQAVHDICFLPYIQVGGIVQGTWFSTTFADWNGRYYQEGDEVKMTGDFFNNVGHDHMTLIHTTADVPGVAGAMAFKDWTQWLENGQFGLAFWGNARLERIGSCPTKLAGATLPQALSEPRAVSIDELRRAEGDALKISLSVPERLTAKGERPISPTDPNLESLDAYFKRTGQGSVSR